jgi:hypothetical protein
MTDVDEFRARLAHVTIELADVEYRERELLVQAAGFLDVLGDRDDATAHYLADEIRAVADRRSCLSIEAHELAAELRSQGLLKP